MENLKFDPPTTQKWPNRSSSNFARVITLGSPTIMRNFITMRSGFLNPVYVKLSLLMVLIKKNYLIGFFFRFCVCGFFRQASAETAAPILTLNTSNGVVLRKDVPFGGPVNDVLHLLGQIPQKPLQKGRE